MIIVRPMKPHHGRITRWLWVACAIANCIFAAAIGNQLLELVGAFILGWMLCRATEEVGWRSPEDLREQLVDLLGGPDTSSRQDG